MKSGFNGGSIGKKKNFSRGKGITTTQEVSKKAQKRTMISISYAMRYQQFYDEARKSGLSTGDAKRWASQKANHEINKSSNLF